MTYKREGLRDEWWLGICKVVLRFSLPKARLARNITEKKAKTATY
jgi:hypothetical protein